MMDFKTIPKIELHLHIEGSATPQFIKKLADKKNITLDPIFDENGNYAYKTFNEFLSVYESACVVLTTPEDYKQLTYTKLKDLTTHGVVYCEMFVSPDFCGKGDLSAWKEYVCAIQEAAVDAEKECGIILKIITTAVRHFGIKKINQAALCAAHTAGDFVTGFGMGGDEIIGKAKDFVYAYDMAREAKLGLTCHVGEWSDAFNIVDVIDNLSVSRIGHGVRAVEDKNVIKHLVEKNIVLEVNPGSNITLGVYKQWQDHPIDTLYKAEVPITVSTDDPPFFHTTITYEYKMLHKTFMWTQKQFTTINKTAAKAAFCDEQTRQNILKKVTVP